MSIDEEIALAQELAKRAVIMGRASGSVGAVEIETNRNGTILKVEVTFAKREVTP